MKNKIFSIAVIAGLLTFLTGWFLHSLIESSNQKKDTQLIPAIIDDIKNIDSMKSNRFSDNVSGHFILSKSKCAGFNFIDKNTVLWTNEIACDDPDTLKLRWLSDSTFMTRSTQRVNESCPPLVDIYQVISFDGNRLTLKSIRTGWNDQKDENLEFIKQPD